MPPKSQIASKKSATRAAQPEASAEGSSQDVEIGSAIEREERENESEDDHENHDKNREEDREREKDRVKILEEKMEAILQALSKSTLTHQPRTPSPPRRQTRNPSPTRSRKSAGSKSSSSKSSTSTISNAEISKELMKLIPRYDGTGGIQRLLEYIDNFEDFAAGAELPSSTELTLATAKLTGDAKMWWREHRKTTSVDDPNRIRNWTMLQKELLDTFAPPEYAETVRVKLRSLKQKGSIAEYNASFRRLSMQITMEFEEAKFVYVQGLSPRIRELVRTKDGITDIRKLMLACLKLDVQGEKHSQTSEAYTADNTTKSSTNFSNKRSQGQGQGRGQGQRGHQDRKTQNQTSRDRCRRCKTDDHAWFKCPNITCIICDAKGHVPKSCPNLEIARESAKKRSSNTAQVNMAQANLVTVIDSGATQHMFNRLDLFGTTTERNSRVKCANNQELKSSLVGPVELEMQGTTTKILQDALYVPELRQNLLSVRALTKEGNDVIFRRNGTVELVEDNSDEPITIGRAVGDLYQLNENENESDYAMFTVQESAENHELWHHRLGHPSRKILSIMPDHVIGLRLSGADKDKNKVDESFCKGCAYAKSHRLPFPRATFNRSKEVLGRIHTDVCGPLPLSIGGAKYILTIIDDATRYATIYFLMAKSDAFGRIVEFHNYTERQTGKKLKIIRSDGGGEFVNHEMTSYLAKNGIHQELTTANTPEQNGVAERYNRTLMEATRALMHTAGVPEELWAELSSTAAYLRNRTPSRAINNKTPFECWFGRKPNVEYLRIIWADAYVHISKSKRTSKISTRSTKMKLIGYDVSKKAYRLWNPTQSRIEIHRDVIFDELAAFNTPNLSVDDEYEIEEIIGEKFIDDEKFYLVKWLGYADEDTWEPRGNLKDTEALEKWSNRVEDTAAYVSRVDNNEPEPTSFAEATSSDDAKNWREAIDSELESINENNTWTIIPKKEITPGRRPIGCKWVFKRKLNTNGEVERYKARLVAKGYAQQQGVDYDETYAPVAKFTSIRVILSIGAFLNMEIHQMDVKTAFLNGDLTEEIYMDVPEGVQATEDNVCKLNKTLYGLKQSPRMWNEKIDEYLRQQKFERLNSDHSIYIRQVGNGGHDIIALYVDDLILLTNTIERMKDLKDELSKKFKMTDCGELHHFLGIRVIRDRQERKLTLDQEHYAKEVITKYGMTECKVVTTPLDPSVQLKAANDDNYADPTLFRQIIGSLMYLMIGTRPDLAAAVSIVSQFASNPTQQHLQAAKRIIRYLKKSAEQKLHLGSTKLRLIGYSDANWGNDQNSRRSTSGYLFYYGGLVSWSSKKQATVALSSTEAEYMALTHATKEAIWLRSLISELKTELRLTEPTLIYEDNQSCIALAKNPVQHARTKHIDIQHHFIRDKVDSKEIELAYSPTDEMIADALTKALPHPRFSKHVESMGLKYGNSSNTSNDATSQ